MWTNVFRIGELNLISWFQFVPCESDPTTVSDKSLKGEQKDAATFSVLSAHLNLQNEGFLTAWTNSFVGPWDPSQGVHNPDEKIKLWLFLPGRHTSVVDTAKASLTRLKGGGSGIWSAPGDSEEVAVALSQALRNRIERTLRGFSYVRFGDVFMKCHSFSTVGKSHWSPQLALEFVFSASEEALYVHAIFSVKNVRALSNKDLEGVLAHSSCHTIQEGLPVIVATNGMRGRLTGCCPSDIVKQVFSRNISTGSTLFSMASASPGCQLQGQNCYVEVAIGCPSCGSEKISHSKSSPDEIISPLDMENATAVAEERGKENHGSTDQFSILEKTFLFPVEMVLVPILYKTFAKSSLKRLWLSTSRMAISSVAPSWNISGSSFITHCLGFGGKGDMRLPDNLLVDSMYVHGNKCNTNSSNMSSTSSTSSESDDDAVTTDEFEANVDSFNSSMSGFCSNDQHENEDSKRGTKRSLTGTTESIGRGNVASGIVQDSCKSNYNVVGTNSPLIPGFGEAQCGSFWDFTNRSNGSAISIDDLISEFGGFADFFEDDLLDLGEPPGTAESQAHVFSVADCGDISDNQIVGGADASDKTPLSGSALPHFEEFMQHSSALNNELLDSNMDPTKDARPSAVPGYSIASSSRKYDYVMKAEAIITLASEYSAVKASRSEFSTSIFRSPYLPKCKRVESPSSILSYTYSANPPSSPLVGSSEEKTELSAGTMLSCGDHVMSSINSLKYYNHVEGRKNNIKNTLRNEESSSHRDDSVSFLAGSTIPTSKNSLIKEKENFLEAGRLLFSLKTVLATEVECSMFQAAMCRIRHILLTCNNQVPLAANMLAGRIISDQALSNTYLTENVLSNRYISKKKDSVPVRIAGDMDAVLDRPVASQVGVWRAVGAPKTAMPSNTMNLENSSFSNSCLIEEDLPINDQRQSLQELVDAMALLVQQSTSFVDISLDACDGDGPYYWLTLQEQIRRGFACGPSNVHAGCGGLLASCHSVDIAGVDLIDPLSGDVSVSSVISLLLSDIKVSLKTAFGNLDGPLSMTDWCKGHSQSNDATFTGDIVSAEFHTSEASDSSSTTTFAGDPISPSTALVSGISSLKDGSRIDDSSQRRSNHEVEQQASGSRFRSTISALPLPALLVGYQDDWLKTSASALQLWEKGPLEPYALPKPITYYAVCPDIDLLTSAAADFFQQFGTVYESCKLGSHSPHPMSSQIDIVSKKWSSSGIVPVDCPSALKTGSACTSGVGAVGDYLLALSKSWDLKGFLLSLSSVLKILKFGLHSAAHQKDGNNVPCVAVYVICPFLETTAVLQTLVESCASLGSAVHASVKDRRSLLYSQVSKALSSATASDEALVSNIVMLTGFSMPKLVLQIVGVDLLLRINKPRNDLAILKDLAFTVYNKARRIVRSFSNNELIPSLSSLGKSHSTTMHVGSSTQGLWKDCLAPRISASATGLTRETELDSTLRSGAWDSSWQSLRTGLNCDPNRSPEFCSQEDVRCMFEPLFVLAERGTSECGNSFVGFNNTTSNFSNSRSLVDDTGSGFTQASTSGAADVGTSSLDGSEYEQKVPSLHCCYGWTEDWRWLMCIWTDSRGELLDSQIFPFGGISCRQDTKVLQSLFVQILHQGCQILSCSSDSGIVRARDIIITRIGCFFELECQEWQKAIYFVGGNEVRKWPLQLRRSVFGASFSNNGASLQQQDISLVQERTIPPPTTSMYSYHAKSSSYMKGALGSTNIKKAIPSGQSSDGSRGFCQLVQSISLVGVSVDHSLHLILPGDSAFSGGGTQASSSSISSSYLDGFTPIKSPRTTSSSYIFVPYPSVTYLPPLPLQLPACLTSESPPLAHLLHSKGSAIPLSTGYVISKAVSSVRKDPTMNTNEEWPSILSVTLIDHYGGIALNSHEKVCAGGSSSIKQVKSLASDVNCREYELEKHMVLESVAAELHSLSWLTVSPVYTERRTALPFHCDMLMRLRRLLYYAEKQLCQPPEK